MCDDNIIVQNKEQFFMTSIGSNSFLEIVLLTIRQFKSKLYYKRKDMY